MPDQSQKILVISNMFPSSRDPYYGTFVKKFYEDLCKVNHISVKLIAIKGRKFSLAAKIIAYLSFFLKIFYYVSFFNYKFIYVHTISHPTPPLRIISFFKNLPVIYNIHGDDLLTTTTLAAKLLEFAKPLLKRAKAIVVPSEYFKEVLFSKIPFTKNINVIISPSGGVAKDFYCKSYPDNSVPLLGYVSRIDEGKGWSIMIEALKILKRDNVPFNAKFFGRGDQASLLEKEISNSGLNDCVSYEGPKSHTELPYLYARFDIFVFPTQRAGESLGLVGLEAMAASTPVIGSDMAGLRTYIKEGENGFLFPPGDARRLAEIIKGYLLLPKDEKEIMRNNAYKTALDYESSLVNNTLFNKLLG